MVRATFAGMTTAFSALQANQKRLDITGQNLANMNTTGYTRQQLKASSFNYTNPISHYMNGSEVSVGFGVHMDTITQIRDPYLDAQYRSQIQKSGYTDSVQTSLDRLSNIFDESHVSGIRHAFDDIQSSLENMQDPPKVNDAIYESELRTRMQTLTNRLNESARLLNEAEMAEFTKLDGTGTNEQGAVQRVNDILEQIGTLNRQIKNNQIYNQPSLELMDERNVLLDELASYIPIEVSYYKDESSIPLGIEKDEWPDDLRVTMRYQKDGTVEELVLVDGTKGKEHENHLKLDIPNSDDIRNGTNNAEPADLVLNFHKLDAKGAITGAAVASFSKADPKTQFPSGSGSIQAGLDMLWKNGSGDPVNNVKGYDYYRNELDKLASAFATVMNTLNNYPNGGNSKDLLATKDGSTAFTAENITISQDWISYKIHVSKEGDNPTDTVMNMLEAMGAFYPYTKNPAIPNTVDLNNNSFANYMNHISTVLANDSYNNTESLKANVTVLNGIQDSRDSMSGVSLDEEASNMMMYMSAYNAASRLMTTLDQALDILINGTGMVGR